MKSNGILTKELLVELYIVQRKSTPKVAHETGFPPWTISYWMKKFGIEKRSCHAYPVWNKGLTKENDERVRKNIESYCRTMKKRYPNWTRGHLGKPHSAEAKKRMSEAKKGTHHSLETRRKMSMARTGKGYGFKKGHKPWNKGLTKDVHPTLAEAARRMLGNQRSKGCSPWNKGMKMPRSKYPVYWGKERIRQIMSHAHRKPNKLEEQAILLIAKHGFPYSYCGSGKVIIGGKCPDFIHANGKKKIIEIFGVYWHGEKRTGHSKETEERERVEHFRKYGFDTLVIWERELRNLQSVAHKIAEFDARINFLAGA